MVRSRKLSSAIVHPQQSSLMSWTSEKSQHTLTEYVDLVTHILHSAQMLCGQKSNVAEYLCQQIEYMTRGRVKLLLYYKRPLQETTDSSPTGSLFPVQFQHFIYGTLFIASHPSDQQSLWLSRPLAHLLAQICGWLLYTLEISALVQKQQSPTNCIVQKLLTKRQREILELLASGHDQEMIAEMLGITVATVEKHRQHIYERLDVHNEYEAILTAYQRGIFSPIQELSQHVLSIDNGTATSLKTKLP